MCELGASELDPCTHERDHSGSFFVTEHEVRIARSRMALGCFAKLASLKDPFLAKIGRLRTPGRSATSHVD